MSSNMVTQLIQKVESREEIVQKIVDEWNNLVTKVESGTIAFCLKVQKTLKKYPDKTAKEIIQDVSNHPDLVKSISLDRAWAGLRLIKKRPDVIEYSKANLEERKNLESPVLKQDGEVNYEFYIELYKHHIDEGIRSNLEAKAIKDDWSYRRLLDEIKKTKNPELDLEEITEKRKLIREIAGILSSKNLKFIKSYRKLLDEKEK